MGRFGNNHSSNFKIPHAISKHIQKTLGNKHTPKYSLKSSYILFSLKTLKSTVHIIYIYIYMCVCVNMAAPSRQPSGPALKENAQRTPPVHPRKTPR